RQTDETSLNAGRCRSPFPYEAYVGRLIPGFPNLRNCPLQDRYFPISAILLSISGSEKFRPVSRARVYPIIRESMEDGKAKADLLPGTLDMLVLKLLLRGHLHGYAIAQLIQQLSDDLLRVEEGSLYPALQRLELNGWIEGEWG